MTETYTQHAEICTRFYESTTDSALVSSFLIQLVNPPAKARVLFVGGMYHVARALADLGLDLTCVDYTDEMVELGRKALPRCRVLKADLRALPFENVFDLTLVVGRVFTHMLTERDLSAALVGCYKSLRGGGLLFADNYEDSRIEKTPYFNGLIEGRSDKWEISRNSTTRRISESPRIVEWHANYSGIFNGGPFQFEDSMPHRAFSRDEFRQHVKETGFAEVSQGDNFDETSFYTLAKKAV